MHCRLALEQQLGKDEEEEAKHMKADQSTPGKIKVATIGSGNIGGDLMYKLLPTTDAPGCLLTLSGLPMDFRKVFARRLSI